MLFPSHLESIILDCNIWIVNHFFELTSSRTEKCVSFIKTNGTNDSRPSRPCSTELQFCPQSSVKMSEELVKLYENPSNGSRVVPRSGRDRKVKANSCFAFPPKNVI